MKKDKRLGEDPFEKFLPQIQDSRKKKDADVNSDKNINKDGDVHDSKINAVDKNNDVVTSKNVNNDVNNRDDVNNYRDDVVNSDVSTINGVDKNVNVITDGNTNITGDESVNTGKGTITIPKKKNKSDDYLRVTYYLRPDQIRAINRLHKDSGRDKSELVRLAVDILIEQARVE